MESERLIIDEIRQSDKEDYFRNISHDRKVLETFICQYADDLQGFDFSSYLSNKDLFAIRLKDTGKLIGIILYFDEAEGRCEIGYGIGSDHWTRGYGSEAVKCFIEYLFKEKDMKVIYASFFPENLASKRIMEKCGMTYDHFVKEELEYLGRKRDLIYYSITNPYNEC